MVSVNGHIFLCGLMGVGKTTIGKELAKYCQLEFYDLDHEIEDNSGKSITDLFLDKGESEFRLIETKTLKEVLKRDTPSVIALGGGTLIKVENQELLKNHYSIYLQASASFLGQRLKNNNDRPLLSGVDKTVKLKELLNEREDQYKNSLFEVCVENKTVAVIVKEIAKEITSENS